MAFGLIDLMTTFMMQNIFSPDPLGAIMSKEYYRPLTPILANPSAVSSDITFASIYLLYSNCLFDHPFYNMCGFNGGTAIIQMDMTPLVYKLGTETPRYALPTQTDDTDIEIVKNRLHVTGQWVHTENMLTIDGNTWSKHVFDYSKYGYIGVPFLKKWEFTNNRTVECFRSSAQSGTFIPNKDRVYTIDFPFKESNSWVSLNIQPEKLSQTTFPIVYGVCEIIYSAPLSCYSISETKILTPEHSEVSIEKYLLNRYNIPDKLSYIDNGYLSHVKKEQALTIDGYKYGKHFGWEPLNAPLGSLDSDYLRQPTNPCMNDRPFRTLSYGQDINGALPLYGNGDNVLSIDICNSENLSEAEEELNNNGRYINLGTSIDQSWIDNLITKAKSAVLEEINKYKDIREAIGAEIKVATTFKNYAIVTALEVSKIFAWFFHKTGQQLLQSNTSKYSEHFNRHKLYQKLAKKESYNWNGGSSNFINGEKLVFLENLYDLNVSIIPFIIKEGDSNEDEIKNFNAQLPFTQHYSSLGVYRFDISITNATHVMYVDLFCTEIKLTPKEINKIAELDIILKNVKPVAIPETVEDVIHIDTIDEFIKEEKYAFTPQICDYNGILAFYTNFYVCVYRNKHTENPYFEIYTIKKIHENDLSHQIISSWEKTFVQLWTTKDANLRLIATTQVQEETE